MVRSTLFVRHRLKTSPQASYSPLGKGRLLPIHRIQMLDRMAIESIDEAKQPEGPVVVREGGGHRTADHATPEGSLCFLSDDLKLGSINQQQAAMGIFMFLKLASFKVNRIAQPAANH